jgi:hypothetical protein
VSMATFCKANRTSLTTRGFRPGARDLGEVAGGFRGCRALLISQ